MQRLSIGDTVIWEQEARRMTVVGFNKRLPADAASRQNASEDWPSDYSAPVCQWQDEQGIIHKAVFSISQLCRVT